MIRERRPHVVGLDRAAAERDHRGPGRPEQLQHDVALAPRGTPPRPRGRRTRGSARPAAPPAPCRRRPAASPDARRSCRASVDFPAAMKPMTTSFSNLIRVSVGVQRREHVAHRVAAELVAGGPRQLEREHRLAHHAGGGHRARVGALAQRLGRLLGLDVHRAQRLGERRQRLHRDPRHDRGARRHAALDAAGAVGLAHVAALVVPEDLVVGLRPVARAEVEPVADLDALHRVDRHQRERDARVDALVPGDVRAEPGRHAVGAHLEDPAEALVRLAGAIDLGDHRGARALVEAAHRRRVDALEVIRAGRARAAGAVTPPIRTTWLWTLTPSSRRNAFASAPTATRAAVSRALARSSTLRTSVWPNLSTPGQVGVARARQVHLLDVRLDRPRIHAVRPVRVVAVLDQERHRAAERAAVADAAPDLRAVGLDLHPPAAPVAELAAREVGVDVLRSHLQAGRETLQDGHEAGAMGLPRRRETQIRHRG